MAYTVKHAKTNTVPAWTQSDLDAAIAAGSVPPGTTLAGFVVSTDWNTNHTIDTLGTPSGYVLTANGTGGADFIAPGSSGNVNNIIFNPITSPTYSAGRLLYDADNESLTFYNNDSNVSLQIGQEEWIRVVNTTGSTITNGSAVYISGSSGGMPAISLAIATSVATAASIGLATENIANNAIGYVTILGLVNGLDTSAFTAGAVYVSAVTPGALTQTAPVAPNYRHRVGYVTNVSATVGKIHVTPTTSFLGNGTANQVFGINNAGTAQEVKSLVGTTNQVTVTNTANTITFGLPATISSNTSGNAATVTTNANLTGVITSVGNTTSFGSFTSAQFAAGLTDETGTGVVVLATSPTLVTPNIGAASGTSLTTTGNIQALNLVSQATIAASNTITTTRNNLTATSTDGLIETNTTASTSGVPVQYSPRLRMSGTGFDTTAAASRTSNWVIENRPISGASVKSQLTISYDLNGGGYTTKTTLDDTGNLATTTFNGVPLTAAGSVQNFLTAAGTYTAPFTLTTTGSSGAATFTGGTLNIPQYAGGGTINNFNNFKFDATGITGTTYGALSGLVNGSNTVYTVSNGSYITGTLFITLNGQLQDLGSGGDVAETSPGSGTITFTIAPPTGSSIIVGYNALSSTSTSVEIVRFTGSNYKQVTNTTAESSVVPTSGVGSMTIPSGFGQTGRMLFLNLQGTYQTPSVPGNVVVKIKIGSTVISQVTVNSNILATSSTIRALYGEVYITYYSATTVVCDGSLEFETTAGTVVVPFSSVQITTNPISPTITVATTAQLLDVTSTWSNAQVGQGTVINQATLEVLN